MTTSQGVVTDVGDYFVDIIINTDKYPEIESIFNPVSKSGRFLRKYKIVNNECQLLDQEDNKQVVWNSFEKMSDNVTRLHLMKDQARHHNFSVGDLIGVKSKCCGVRRNVIDVCGGDDVKLRNILLSRQSRMVIRCGLSNIFISNISIVKEHDDQCLSTPGGGPQLGQPGDDDIENVVVSNVRAENTGDDSVALFNVVRGAVIENCFISDSFARGILLRNSVETVLVNNSLERSHIEYRDKNITVTSIFIESHE